jgi:hypothetical protein
VVHRLDVPGAEQNGGRYLRRIEQANALRDVLVGGAGLIVVDGGWIGLEVLAAPRVCGAAVTPTNTSCVAGWQRIWICTGSGTPGRVGEGRSPGSDPGTAGSHRDRPLPDRSCPDMRVDSGGIQDPKCR